MSPTLAEAGKVTVQAFEVVLIGYPFPATAVKVEAVTTVCQDVPPDTSAKLKLPEPSVCNILSAIGAVAGNVYVYVCAEA